MKVDVSKIEKTLRKLKKKDFVLFKMVIKKIEQIILCDEISILHYKNLKYDKSDLRRVHIGSFVLKFKIEKDTIIFIDFSHHDQAYKK